MVPRRMLVPELNATVEVVRGRLTEARADQILRFWSDNGLAQVGARRVQARVSARCRL